MGRQIAAPFISMETLRRRSLRTNKCEIRCIHNAKGGVARPKLTPPPDTVVAQPHRSTQGGGNQLDTERKRYVCSRGRDERRKIANWKDQRSNCFMKNHDAVRRVLGILMPG